MILLLGGTIEGKELAVKLKDLGYSFISTVVTDYGKELALQAVSAPCFNWSSSSSSYVSGSGSASLPSVSGSGPGPCGDQVIQGALDENSLGRLMVEREITVVIDATHPFAEKASLNARAAATKSNVEYIRYERPVLEIPANSLIHKVCGFPEAAAEMVKHGEVIFMATGVNHLEIFVRAAAEAGRQLVVRVLPVYTSLHKCSEMGLKPSQIIAIQGGGSLELNKILLQEFSASLLVTKDSGDAGGTVNKINAALELNLPVILIERPSVNSNHEHKVYNSVEEILRYISQNNYSV